MLSQNVNTFATETTATTKAIATISGLGFDPIKPVFNKQDNQIEVEILPSLLKEDVTRV